MSCGFLCRIPWSQMSSREWRCSWSSADRRCSNYIWVIDNFIAYWCASYIRGFTVCYSSYWNFSLSYGFYYQFLAMMKHSTLNSPYPGVTLLNRVWFRYNDNFLPNPHNTIAHPWDMGCLLWALILIKVLHPLLQCCVCNIVLYWAAFKRHLTVLHINNPDSKFHGAHMTPIFGRQDPGGSHIGPVKLAIWVMSHTPVASSTAGGMGTLSYVQSSPHVPFCSICVVYFVMLHWTSLCWESLVYCLLLSSLYRTIITWIEIETGWHFATPVYWMSHCIRRCSSGPPWS